MRKYKVSLYLIIISICFFSITTVDAVQAQPSSDIQTSIKTLILRYSAARTSLKSHISKKQSADKLAAQKATDKVAAQKVADKLAAQKAAVANTNTYSRAS